MKEHPTRATLWNGGLYVIRDVFAENGKLKTCEYAQVDETGELYWRPCIEGVEFADIDPIGVTLT